MFKFNFRSIFIGLLLMPLLATGQVQETVYGSARIKGGFGGPFFLYSTVAEMNGGGAGGGGGFIVNNFFIGGFGQGETFGRVDYNAQEYQLSIGYGGFWIGYVIPSHKLMHLYTSLKIGWGGAVLSEYHRGDFSFDHDIQYDDAAFVIHPEAGVELNVTHWFRMAAVGGYRFMNGVNDLPTFSSDDFDSPSLSLVMRFGGFGYPRAD